MIRELPTRPVYSPVRNLLLYLTEDCNLRCSYCFVPKTPKTMSRETARQAVDFLLSREIAGHESELELTFFGGEPFLCLDLMEDIVQYARRPRAGRRRRITYAATTNATLAGPRVEELIAKNRMRLLISLDGDEEGSRDRRFVGGRESYSVVARNVSRLVDAASWSAIRMTFHPRSLRLVENVERALELGAPSVALAPVVEADWEGCRDQLASALAELEAWFLKQCRAGRFPPLELTWIRLRRWHHVQQGGSRPARPCAVATSFLAVTTDGQVLPCHRFLHRRDEALGTVASPQLSDERWKYVHLSSSDVLGCSECAAQPVCGGGCRVLALDASSSLTGTHPGHCLLTRLQADMVYRLYATLSAENNAVFRRVLGQPTPLNGALEELALTTN